MVISREIIESAIYFCPLFGCILTANSRDCDSSLLLGGLTAAGIFSVYAIKNWNPSSHLWKGVAVGATLFSPASTAAYFSTECLLNRAPALFSGKVADICKVGTALLASPINTLWVAIWAATLFPDSE
ncbi:MAG: hypothetical protein ACOYK9_05415 [Chlamydiia bacterium]